MQAVLKPDAQILHLGLGSFHRAHQAYYLSLLRQLGDTTWAIAAGNIRPGMESTEEALAQQDGRFTLETVSPAGEYEYKTVTSIEQVVRFDPNHLELAKISADPRTKIISFTVTEAGYYLDSDVRLDLKFKDLADDVEALKTGKSPSTIYGVLTVLLRGRMRGGVGPVTLLNCDNLRHNGTKSREGLKQFLMLIGDVELLQWIEANTTSPNTMVDRITPRPTQRVAQRVLDAIGAKDKAALMSESFIQWVIEDKFVNGRPALEKVGVEFVVSVEPYEEAKIRILNATHSCIAWSGSLIGLTYIHEGTANPDIYQFAFDYVTNSVIPVLEGAAAKYPLNLRRYRDVVLERFGNAAIADTNQRVAADGFSKIPGFIAPTIRELLAMGQSIGSVAMLPALFLAFIIKRSKDGIAFEYQDQSMDELEVAAICNADDPVVRYCSNAVLWGDLANRLDLITAIRVALVRIDVFTKKYTNGP